MKKKVIGSVLALMLTVTVFGGCKNYEAKNDKGTVQDRSGGPTANTPQPHEFGDFKGAGFKFTGGTTVSGYNLSAIRRVPNPQLVRLVFQFTTERPGEPGAAPPTYLIELDNHKIIMRLKGVDRADVMDNKEAVLALSNVIKDISFTKIGSSDGEVTLLLNSQVTFQVFDLGEPARIVVVIKPEGTEDQVL